MKPLPITPEVLSRFRYDPDTPSGLVHARTGTPAGWRSDKGYWKVSVQVEPGKQREWPAHRIVWSLHHGDAGALEVDHIDRDRGNNILENLQAITGDQHRARKVGRGYNWDKGSGKWKAGVKTGGQNVYLGLFDTEEEARAAYVKAKAAAVEGLQVQFPEDGGVTP